MLISTKGRYALRVLIDLAEVGGETYVPMKTVAQRQGVSLKYMERILPVLTRHGFVEGVQGKGGGYRLSGDPAAHTVGEILRCVEGDLAPVSCLEPEAAPCAQLETCRTRALWEGLYKVIDTYLDGITLADLSERR